MCLSVVKEILNYLMRKKTTQHDIDLGKVLPFFG